MVDVGHVGLELLKSTIFQPLKEQLTRSLECSEADMEGWIGYLLAIHDIGKCHPEFQMKAPELTTSLRKLDLPFPEESLSRFYHSVYSEMWLKNHLRKLNWAKKPYITVSSAILGHHGSFKGKRIVDHPKIHETWEKYREALNHIVYTYFDPIEWIPKDFLDHSVVGLLLSGLLVISDWIASNDALFRREAQDDITDIDKYLPFSREVARKAINKMGFNYSSDLGEYNKFSSIWPEFTLLSPIQQAIESQGLDFSSNKLYIIEAPMGDGKTEAALYIATRMLESWRGIYFALPTMATSNQMFGRFRSFLQRVLPSMQDSLQLIHGMAWLVDIFSDETKSFQKDAYDWFKPKKRALIAPFGVGTIDQCLMSVLWVRFGFLRLIGLTEKVLIIDEVHAYDSYMSTILKRLLNWAQILKIPVIMLSATLPLSTKRDLIRAYSSTEINFDSNFENSSLAYPLLTISNSKGTIKYIETKSTSDLKEIYVVLEQNMLEDYNRIVDQAIFSALQDKCVCVLVNTVKNSQEIYKLLEQKCLEKDIPTTLFHARFPIERRLEIEKEVLRLFDKQSKELTMSDPSNPRPLRVIIVATQIVEQSLDLDFDEIISEIAPIDLLIQRMGRLHRHSRPHRPCGKKAVFRIALPDTFDKAQLYFGLTEKVYARYILLKTLEALLVKSETEDFVLRLRFPKDIRTLIETVYGAEDSEFGKHISSEDLSKASIKMKNALQFEQNEARTYLIPYPNIKRFEFSQMENPFKEEEEGVSTFFHAKTRIGNLTQGVLVLNNTSLVSVVAKAKPPSTKVQAELLKKSVNLPRFWFKGMELELKPIKWLSNYIPIFLSENKFEFYVIKKSLKQKRTIINHPIYGVYLEEDL